MSRRALFSTLAALTFGAFAVGSAHAQDWSSYQHWPYTPPQVPGNGFEYRPLYDGHYLYPRDQRIVPQIQGPYYRNWYGGYRTLGHRRPLYGIFDWERKKFYKGNHFILDVF